jgi:hypothetical protein
METILVMESAKMHSEISISSLDEKVSKAFFCKLQTANGFAGANDV